MIMASAKDTKMLTLEDYEEPEEALIAAEAEFGEVEQAVKRQVQRDPGRPDTIGVVSTDPGEPPSDHWIGVKLVDDAGEPIPFERFRVKMSDGSIVEGTLDEKGYRRVEGVEPGSAMVSFPNIDGDEWKPA